jgi:iron complex transport system substrate-binding protein
VAKKVHKIRLYIIVLVLSILSCTSNKDNSNPTSFSSDFPTDYAKGFSISSAQYGYSVNVFNPWQGAKDVVYSYALTTNNNSISSKGFSEVIPIPVNRIVCLSTTHIAFIDYLNKTELIVGISGANYISNPTLRKNIDSGIVKDVGFEQALNFELLLNLKPDVVFSYGVGAEMAGYIQKFKDLGIPTVFIGDYLEENPLGKAEWLKLFGLFVGKFSVADSLFKAIEIDYLNVKHSISDVKNRPKVFINTPWKDVWYFTGNNGYMARLIDDAGGNYLLSRLDGNRSYPFSIEAAIEYGIEADVWINTGSATSLKEIGEQIPIINKFPPVIGGRVYNNNLRINEFGGNDFWESGVVNPHLVLRDLVKIFHPDSINHSFVYYQRLLK